MDQSGKKRPLLITHTGFDGSAEEFHSDGARAAVERGYNVLAFDGPGQFGPLHRERLPFRPDWEKVVTPVVDFALTLLEIDPALIALMGISMGGVLCARAAAFEKRIAALISNDGLYDMGATILANFPKEQHAEIIASRTADEAPEVDKMLSEISKKSTTMAWQTDHGDFAFGITNKRKGLAEILKYHVRDGNTEAVIKSFDDIVALTEKTNDSDSLASS